MALKGRTKVRPTSPRFTLAAQELRELNLAPKTDATRRTWGQDSFVSDRVKPGDGDHANRREKPPLGLQNSLGATAEDSPSGGSFWDRCSILLQQKRTGELRLVRATSPQLASHNRKLTLPIRRGCLTSPFPREQPGNKPSFSPQIRTLLSPLALFSLRRNVRWPLLRTGPIGTTCAVDSPFRPGSRPAS